MKTFLAVCLVLIATAVAQQASAICTTDSTCNNYGTFQQQRCEIPTDPLLAVCQGRSTYQYRSTTIDNKGMCKDSLNFGVGATQACGGYGVAGCSVPAVDLLYVNCIAGTSRNFLTEKCETNNVTTIATKGLGERCNLDGVTDPQVGCGNNLVCVNFVCRQKLERGDNCLSSPYGCGNGMVCDRELCKIAYTGVAQDPCSTSAACLSGVCQDGRCQERRSIPCYNNADCAGSADGTCFIRSGETRGFCTNNAHIARFRYNMCVYNQASSVRATTVDFTTVCESAYVDMICAQQCSQRPDLRKQNDGYIYNCQTSTRTKITTGCDIKATVTGCDTTPLSGAFSQALSFVVVIVAALMVIA